MFHRTQGYACMYDCGWLSFRNNRINSSRKMKTKQTNKQNIFLCLSFSGAHNKSYKSTNRASLEEEVNVGVFPMIFPLFIPLSHAKVLCGEENQMIRGHMKVVIILELHKFLESRICSQFGIRHCLIPRH